MHAGRLSGEIHGERIVDVIENAPLIGITWANGTKQEQIIHKKRFSNEQKSLKIPRSQPVCSQKILKLLKKHWILL